MSKQLIKILEHELELLETSRSLAEEQRIALVEYNHDKIYKISEKQETNAKKIFELENERVNFLINWLQINKSEAQKITINMIIDKIQDNEIRINLIRFKNSINEVIKKINDINSLNRLLATRARRTIHEILSVISGGNNHLCNVKI